MRTTNSIRISAAIIGISAAAALGLARPDMTVQLVDTFDYPGTGNLTRPQKINDQGDIIGIYIDAKLATRGFIRYSDGSFSPPLVDPNAIHETEARGINNSKLICGDYFNNSTGTIDGFFLTGRSYIDYDVPGATATMVFGLNNTNDFCGSATINGVQLAFLNIGGTVSTFFLPHANATFACQINDSNQSCGYSIDRLGNIHGLYRDSDGTIHSPIDPPGGSQTLLLGNNNSNVIVGRYVENATGFSYGIVFFPPRTHLIYGYPGSTYTSLNGINNRNMIVGRYIDDSGLEHGILARLAPGTDGAIGIGDGL
jgi:hypothetical protein